MNRTSTFLLIAVAATMCMLETSAEAQLLRRRNQCCPAPCPTTVCATPVSCATPACNPCPTPACNPCPTPACQPICATCPTPAGTTCAPAFSTYQPAPTSTVAYAQPLATQPACNTCAPAVATYQPTQIQPVSYAQPIATQPATANACCECCPPTLGSRLMQPLRFIGFRN